MEVKQAVAVAKSHLVDVLGDETIEPPTLEEVWYNEKKKVWHVTLGVRRPPPPNSAAAKLGMSTLSYKTVTIADADGKIKALNERLIPGLSG